MENPGRVTQRPQCKKPSQQPQKGIPFFGGRGHTGQKRRRGKGKVKTSGFKPPRADASRKTLRQPAKDVHTNMTFQLEKDPRTYTQHHGSQSHVLATISRRIATSTSQWPACYVIAAVQAMHVAAFVSASMHIRKW